MANTDFDFKEDLMQLFSVVNIRIKNGCVYAGNSTLPSTLAMKLSSAKMELVTEKSQSLVDDYCFILRGDVNKFECSFIPNTKLNASSKSGATTGPVSGGGGPPTSAEKKLDSNRVLVLRSVHSDFEYVQVIYSKK